MKKQFLLGLLLLSACASRSNAPNIAAIPADPDRYRADLASCENWAAPTRHEWAMRCAANGEMVLVSHIIDSLGHDDPRDRETKRQSMPNNTKYRLTMCLKAKGYKIDTPNDTGIIASP